jgi:N-acyl-D-amino-acid deacylase
MFDVAIRNGYVVDGSRLKGKKAAVYISGGKIAEISEDAQKPARESYDAEGKIVSPGFVDIHSHSDLSYAFAPAMETKLMQGVTFELAGQCGGSSVPTTPAVYASIVKERWYSSSDAPTWEEYPVSNMTEYAADFDKRGASINMSSLIGHGTLRSCVMGWEMRQATPEELDKMCGMLDEMLRQGAPGISFGLIYPPGSFCDTAEVIALAKVVAKHDKMLAVHMRNENAGVFKAFQEMIDVAKATGVKLQISHFKLMGVAQWGRADELLHMLDLARAQGVRVHCDQYPFMASNSGLTSCVPLWALDGGRDKLVERNHTPELTEELNEGIIAMTDSRGGPDRVVVSLTHPRMPEYENKSLSEIAGMLGVSVVDAIRELLVRTRGQVGCIYHSISEGDMLKIMARTDICVATDGSSYSLTDLPGKPHPRNGNTFPAFLKYVREHKLMSIEDAVYKMTALPATLMGFDGSFGYLRPGYAADVTVFDWDKIEVKGTYADITPKPEGIDYVFTNGRLVYDHGTFTENRPGKFYLK